MEGGDPQQLRGAGTAAGLEGGPRESPEEACLSRVLTSEWGQEGGGSGEP